MIRDEGRAPRNAFERLLWLHGRKFWVALFAGISAFIVTLVGIWVTARVSAETGRTVEAIVNGYLWTSAGMVGAYSASNAVVERAHARQAVAGNGARPSGAVQPQREDA